MTRARHNPATNPASERGSIYVATLATATLVTVIAISGLTLARLERRTATVGAGSGVAREAARSGLEVALDLVNRPSSWRSSTTVYTGTIDGCGVTVKAEDSGDGLLADGACDTVWLVSEATRGSVRERIKIRLDPAASEAYSTLVDGMYPVGYWPLRDITGSYAPDVRGVSNGIVVGGVELDGGACKACYGAPGFGTTGAYITIPHNAAYLLGEGTICFWLYADSNAGDQGLLSKTDKSPGQGEVDISLKDAELVVAYATGAGNGEMRGGNVRTGEWTHVAVTFGEGGGRVYLNGSPLMEDSGWIGGMGLKGNGSGNLNPIVLGGMTRNASPGTTDDVRGPFNGRLGDVAIFAYELSDAQILQLAGETPGQRLLEPTGRERSRVVD